MKRPLLVGSVTMVAQLLMAASLLADKTKSEEAFDRSRESGRANKRALKSV